MHEDIAKVDSIKATGPQVPPPQVVSTIAAVTPGQDRGPRTDESLS